MESLCDSPDENSWCGKAPRGSILALFLFFLGQLLLIRAVGRELGWVGPWSWWSCSAGMQAATCWANLGNRTRAQLALEEAPQMVPELWLHGELILPLASISLGWDSCCHRWGDPSPKLAYRKYCYSSLLFAAWAFSLRGHGRAPIILVESTNIKMLNSQRRRSTSALTPSDCSHFLFIHFIDLIIFSEWQL